MSGLDGWKEGEEGSSAWQGGGYVRVWGRWYSFGRGFYKRLDVISMYSPPLP